MGVFLTGKLWLGWLVEMRPYGLLDLGSFQDDPAEEDTVLLTYMRYERGFLDGSFPKGLRSGWFGPA